MQKYYKCFTLASIFAADADVTLSANATRNPSAYVAKRPYAKPVLRDNALLTASPAMYHFGPFCTPHAKQVYADAAGQCYVAA